MLGNSSAVSVAEETKWNERLARKAEGLSRLPKRSRIASAVKKKKKATEWTTQTTVEGPTGSERAASELAWRGATGRYGVEGREESQSNYTEHQSNKKRKRFLPMKLHALGFSCTVFPGFMKTDYLAGEELNVQRRNFLLRRGLLPSL